MKTEKPFQQGLPCDPEAERIVLGSIVITPQRFAQLGSVLGSEDFFLERNKRVWTAIKALAEKNVEPNMINIGHFLMDNQQLPTVGGLDYICSLQDNVSDLLEVDHYVHAIKETAALRNLVSVYEDGICRCFDRDNVGTIMSETTSRINAINRPFSVKDRFQKAGDLIAEQGGMDAFLSNQVCRRGLELPFPRLDDALRGLHSRHLTVLAARPSFGKTALALQIACHVGCSGSGVVIFSLESPKEDLIVRMACCKAQVSLDRALRGTLKAEERVALMAATQAIHDAPIYFNDNTNVHIAALKGDLAALKDSCGVKLMVLDYLQLMASGRINNRNEAVSEISRGLKLALMELKIAGLVLSQLTREPAKGVWRPPVLSDLRDSGAIEQDADEVWFIHKRQPKYDKGTCRLITAKHRNGPLGKIDFAFQGSCTRFQELEKNEIWPEEN